MIMPRVGASWQLILADLSLILFLVTLAALAGTMERDGEEAFAIRKQPHEISGQSPAIAPVQALYRPAPDVPPFGAWLAGRPNDPRARLTIYATYSQNGEADTWDKVRAMAAQAASAGASAKVMITPGARDDIYASFAFDAPPSAQPQAARTLLE